MALYLYVCNKCGAAKEELIYTKRPDHLDCECGGVMDHKITGIRFKLLGEGWASQGYETPNREMLKKCGDGVKFTPDEKPFERRSF